VPIVNELHGKIAFDDDDGVIPRDAPLMIWNDALDLGALGTFPSGGALPSARRAIDSRDLDVRHACRAGDVPAHLRA
jgi:hypothetical protein